MSLLPTKEQRPDLRFCICVEGHTERTWIFADDAARSRVEKGKFGPWRVIWQDGGIETFDSYDAALKRAIPAPCPF